MKTNYLNLLIKTGIVMTIVTATVYCIHLFGIPT